MKAVKLFLCSVFMLFATNLVAQNNSNESDNGTSIIQAMKDEMDDALPMVRNKIKGDSIFIDFLLSRNHHIGVCASDGQRAKEVSLEAYGQCAALVTSYGNGVLIGQNVWNNRVQSLSYNMGEKEIRKSLQNQVVAAVENLSLRKKVDSAHKGYIQFRSLPSCTSVAPSVFSKRISEKRMGKICTELSKCIKNIPLLKSDTVGLTLHRTDIYRLTSEGQTMRIPECYYIVEAVVYGKHKDGQMERFTYYKTYSADDFFSSSKQVKDDFSQYLKLVEESCEAGTIAEDVTYRGPVLFENSAAWSALFLSDRVQNALYSHRNSRSYPYEMNVCNPQISISQVYDETNRNNLLGAYRIDANGVQPKNVMLVKDGVLVNKLGGRILYDEQATFTGNTRISQMHPKVEYGILRASAKSVLSAKDIRQHFLRDAKSKGLQKAYIIRPCQGLRMLFQVDVNTGEETMINGWYEVQDYKPSDRDEFSQEEFVMESLFERPLSSFIFPKMVYAKDVCLSIKQNVPLISNTKMVAPKAFGTDVHWMKK